jgi:hypothetical protein
MPEALVLRAGVAFEDSMIYRTMVQLGHITNMAFW